MANLFVVLYRGKIGKGRWTPESNACFETRDLAEKCKEVETIRQPAFEFAILEGTTLPDNDELTESF
jgi:hypothetical protein